MNSLIIAISSLKISQHVDSCFIHPPTHTSPLCNLRTYPPVYQPPRDLADILKKAEKKKLLFLLSVRVFHRSCPRFGFSCVVAHAPLRQLVLVSLRDAGDARDDVLTPSSTHPRHLSRIEGSNCSATPASGHGGYIFHGGQSPSMGFTSL